MELRPYQSRIVDAIQHVNAIVKMPTGSGKTVVAAALIQRKLEQSNRTRILFLVPTRELVNQQACVVERWCPGAVVGRYHGGIKQLTYFQVLVSTSAAFRLLQANNVGVYTWNTFSLVVFDEVHHVLKDHPYRHIAMGLLEWHDNNDNKKVQTLGLSASLTYEVQELRIQETLNRLCRELSIETMLSPSVDELEAGGYVPQHGRNVEVVSTRQVPEGVLPAGARKPHLMHSLFMKRIEEGRTIELASDVMNIVRLLEVKAITFFPSFESPLSNGKLSSWEDYAYKLRRKCSVGHDFFASLEYWYVALRVLVQTWEEEVQIVLQWLKMNNAMARLPPSLQDDPSVKRIRSHLENEHNLYKLGCLRSQISAKKDQYGDAFKCIVFVQQRFTAMVVAHFLNQFDSSLQAGYVASRGSSVTPSIRVTKGIVAGTIDAFRDGRSSVLVATSVVEEGFDVPEANVVILYDHLKDSVELCQRFGRARATDCSIVVMDERHDRPLAFLEQVRQEQDELVQNYDPAAQARADPEVERQRQANRERAAFQAVLADYIKCTDTPALALNEYVKKTKALLNVTMENDQNGKFICELTYASHLRRLVVRTAADTKKAAKGACCKELLCQLKAHTRNQV